MTDDEHAAAIRAIVHDLNRAITAAWDAGLAVRIETMDLRVIQRADAQPHVHALVARPL